MWYLEFAAVKLSHSRRILMYNITNTVVAIQQLSEGNCFIWRLDEIVGMFNGCSEEASARFLGMRKNKAVGTESVSYTHLDVYKRQCVSCRPFYSGNHNNKTLEK